MEGKDSHEDSTVADNFQMRSWFLRACESISPSDLQTLVEMFESNGLSTPEEFYTDMEKRTDKLLTFEFLQRTCHGAGLRAGQVTRICDAITAGFAIAPYGVKEDLNAASYKGDIETVRQLTHRYKYNSRVIDWQDGGGCAGVHWAAMNGSDCILAMLIKAGASLNTTTATGQTALMCARNKNREACVDLLCKADAYEGSGISHRHSLSPLMPTHK